MHIAMFSINPLFPDQITGGASKHLKNIAIHLGELGHRVTILATRSATSHTPFHWHENVEIRPTLRFKQPFPQPYAVTAYDVASIVQDVGDVLNTADRFYLHDGELLYPFLHRHIPTVVSLRDNVYPETIHGAFLFQSDKLVLISDYSRRFYLATAGRFFPDLPERIEVIHNGIDWDVFRPTEPGEILRYLPFDPRGHTVILHPHRPEESKGIMQTIAVVDRLVNRHGMTDIRTLIPRWMDEQITPELRGFYDRVESEIVARGLRENIVLHDWIPQRLMPEYYSLGSVTFSLGHFAESFGNSVYESLGCGTPSVAARITTHRELLPDSLMDKVDFDDADTAAELASAIIREGRRTSAETLAYLKAHYSIERQFRGYVDVILNAKVADPLPYRYPALDEHTSYILAPWCYRNSAGRVYHDFHTNYVSLGVLGELLDAHPSGVSRAQALQAGMTDIEFEDWYRRGYIVPVTGAVSRL